MQDSVWLEHYPAEVQPSYDYPKQHLARFMIDSAEKYPDQIAIHFLGKKLTYKQLLDSTYRMANSLLTLGVQKGDRVAIMLPNCPQAVISYYGALLTGAVVVQTNPLYTERELKHQLTDSGSEYLITLDILSKRVNNVLPETDVKHTIFTSIKDYLPFPKNVLYPLTLRKDGLSTRVDYSTTAHSFKRCLMEADTKPVLVEVDAERDLALLQYTGGTTGLSKGVMLTHYNLIANTLQTKEWSYQSTEGEERYLAALPFFHVFGMTVLMNLAMRQAGMLLLLPRFEAETTLKLIDKMKPTIFPGAPTMYIALLHHPNIRQYDLSSINICISGAAPLPGEVQEQFESITGGKLTEGYGLTEASPVTHANNIWGKRKIGSIGIPFPNTEAKIINPSTEEELEIGEVGELLVKGPQIMSGYWNAPAETARVLKDGWLYTGDMAQVDEEGYFYIMDRKKDIIIAGGFNIYPREVEEVLFEHPAVMDAVVAGIPDEYRGETVKAFLILKQGVQVDIEEVDQFCRERLAAYKVPRSFEIRDSLPKTLIGKTLRRKVVEEELNKQKKA
ncbi:long-chain-fatty-acid--CoA ligase [Alkalicoccobacillus porphyridii]|uniref:Long-chain fatty acid--CoA ligase n=1 Tax=Alkalicoccobacillus porphyridii TaxID=2597270 RepID=A0A553ZX10_9BACI|nr:long-chain fatty acid--CoA ligase [Alkalicoccobacillus porphyridii]TSB45983.1 long-chain fatty acid--CoA ligase [Alkalicoccobacillus porphyridii]